MLEKFPPLINDCILRTAKGQPSTRLPVWVMRQAGRYLPEFQEIRKKHDFFTICRTPELCCEVTLQPIKRFDLDAAIIFSDILVIPQALGLEVQMVAGVGPKFPNPLQSVDDLKRLNWAVDIQKELSYVYESIAMTRHRLDGKVPLIGFSGAPWTLFSYMVEGGGSTTWSKAKRWLYKNPEASQRVLRLITDAVITHLVLQAAAGAQLLQVFESHAGALTPPLFHTFALPYLIEIAQEVRSRLTVEHQFDLDAMPPLIVFAKDGHYALDQLAHHGGYNVLGLDWTISPTVARSIAGPDLTLQGNLDPCALYAPDDDLMTLVDRMIREFGTNRYIVNLGHGIYPDTDPSKLQTLVDCVHRWNPSPTN